MPGMRLRLRIQRNELPTVSTLWPIPETQLRYTISQLLDAVNRSFPLESDTWGLEHYIVTIAGFECLHYHELGQVCKDEDEIVIRPLMYVETRARTLTGRDQITPDGRHLTDGLPFGRPLLRGVVRPNVRIPAMKRKREEMEEMIQTGIPVGRGIPSAMDMALTRIEAQEDEEEDSEEDDGDFEVQDSDDQSDAAASGERGSDESSEDESDSDDESSSSTSGTSDSDSDSDDSASEASWQGINSAAATSSNRAAASKTELGSRMEPHVNGVNGTSTSAVKRKAPAEDLAISAASTAKKVKIDNAPPYQGKPGTKSRNQRKRDAKHLQHLKRAGVLDPNADLKALHDYQQNNQRSVDHLEEMLEVSPNDQHHTASADDSELREDQANEVTGPAIAAKPRLSKKAQMESMRQQLLQNIAMGGIDINDQASMLDNANQNDVLEDEVDEAPEQQSSKEPVAAIDGITDNARPAASSTTEAAKEKPKMVTATDMVPSSVARRNKLDVAGSQRLLLGSLGVRAPKNAEEREALQKKFDDKAKKLPGIAPRKIPQKKPEVLPAEAQEDISANDDNAWRSKIDLSAVECCEEGMTLSTPPFPFYQRWDPQQKKKKAKGRGSQSYAEPNKRRKRGRKDDVANGQHVETYDKYNAGADGDALDYDDVEDEDDEEYWEEGALLDGDKKEESEEDDGFPPLPVDLTTLPALAQADAKIHDYIIFTELVCSSATSWQPKMLTHSAKLLEHDEGTWKLQLAQRDMGKKEYDADGNRIYKKFEMEGLSDDEGDDDERSELERILTWAEMSDVKLLLRPVRDVAVEAESQD